MKLLHHHGSVKILRLLSRPVTRFLLLIFLAGCSATVPSAPETIPQVEVKPPPAPKIEKTTREVLPEPPPIVRARKTLIVASDESPAYSGVARRLQERIGSAAVSFNLQGFSQRSINLRKEFDDGEYDQVIAVGLLAATVTKDLPVKHRYFCQVFNYQEHGLLDTGWSGVELLPPPDEVLRYWRQIDPQLQTVALLVGPGLDEYLAEAQRSARRLGIELRTRVVGSDKELLFFSKRLEGVDGQWLLPDNRILSAAALKELVPYQLREGRQVAVFDEELLKLGGLFSVRYDPQDVAECVAGLTESDGAAGQVVPLTKAQIEFNSRVAERLGLAGRSPQTGRAGGS